MSNKILHVDASARVNGSLSREITRYLVESINDKQGAVSIYRDLANSELPLLTESHIGAYFTPKDQRDKAQQDLLVTSDELIQELKSVKTLVIGAPIYNFSVPAALKAWIDLVCRVGETFVYSDHGPKGLLDIDRAYIVVTSGGTQIGSDIDFNSRYLEQVCRFIGVQETYVIDASGSKREPDAILEAAKQQITYLISTATAA